MTGPLLLIRADASLNGGTGHIMRCLALAQQWILRGGKVGFISNSLPPAMEKRLFAEACKIHKIPAQAGSPTDAAETSKILTQLKPNWLLIDSYPLTPDYQKQLQIPQKTKVACISDFGITDFHEPDLVINPNIAATADYSSIAKTTTILSGPNFILLRKELLREKIPQTTPLAKKILISLGGSDPQEASYHFCNYLQKTQLPSKTEIKIILGPAYPPNGLAHQLSHPNIKIIQNPSSMADQYTWADTIICSPSTTAFEAAHHGLPIGLIVTADNQHEVAKALTLKHAALSISTSPTTVDNPKNLDKLLSSNSRLETAKNASNLIDGLGCSRICSAMQLPEIHLRKADIEDAKILWEWNNDPAVRAVSFHTDPIPWQSHLDWMENQLASPTSLIIIASDEHNSPLGTVRFNLDENDKQQSIISITLAPQCRGRKLATIIIQKTTSYFFKQFPKQDIIAWIKTDNIASQKAFTQSAFKNDPSETQPDLIRMRLRSPLP